MQGFPTSTRHQGKVTSRSPTDGVANSNGPHAAALRKPSEHNTHSGGGARPHVTAYPSLRLLYGAREHTSTSETRRRLTSPQAHSRNPREEATAAHRTSGHPASASSGESAHDRGRRSQTADACPHRHHPFQCEAPRKQDCKKIWEDLAGHGTLFARTRKRKCSAVWRVGYRSGVLEGLAKLDCALSL